MADINIYGRLHNATTDGEIASAAQVKDAALDKFQDEINGDFKDGLASLDEAINKKQDTLVSGTNIKTINGASILGSGNLTIDLSLYNVVTTLPTSGIDENKIYLVISSVEGEANKYTEYIYVNSAWEKVGEYKAEVDLSPYAKKTEAVGSATFGESTVTEDNITYPLTVTTVSGDKTTANIVIPAATISTAGLMTANNLSKLENIDAGATYDRAITVDEIDEICV